DAINRKLWDLVPLDLDLSLGFEVDFGPDLDLVWICCLMAQSPKDLTNNLAAKTESKSKPNPNRVQNLLRNPNSNPNLMAPNPKAFGLLHP
ncbi:unnamed protein product, partial [Rotaria sp. Silwood1]